MGVAGMVQLTKLQLVIGLLAVILITHIASKAFVVEPVSLESCRKVQRKVVTGGNAPILGDGRNW